MQKLKYVVGSDQRPLVPDIQNFTIDFNDAGIKNWVQARQYESSMRQVFLDIVNEDGTPFDLTGCNIWFEGLTPDNHRVIFDRQYVPIDPTAGQARIDFLAPAFAMAGSYKQAFFRIYKDGNNISTLEFKFSVLADKVISGIVSADYIQPFEALYGKLTTILDNADGDLKAKLTEWTTKFTDLMTSLSQQGTDTSNMLANVQTTLKNLELQISSDGILHQADLDSGLKSITNLIGDLTVLKSTGASITEKVEHEMEYRGVNVEWFGAVCDGVTDDSKAIQKAIDYCFANGGRIVLPAKKIAIGSTIFIPVNNSQNKHYDYDFGGATFVVADKITLFESGIKSTNEYVSTSSADDVDEYYNFNILIHNFHISGGKIGLHLSNYHQGCAIYDISANDCLQVIVGSNMYYSRINNIPTKVTTGSTATNPERFVFKGASNLMTITHLVAENSIIGYLFDEVSAMNFSENSFEGTGTGLKVIDNIYDSIFSNNYAEKFDSYAYDFSNCNIVQGVRIDGDWININTDSTYYINNAQWSGNSRLIIGAGNHYQGNKWEESKMFSNKSYGAMTIELPNNIVHQNDVSGLYVDENDYPANAQLEQIVSFSKDGNQAGPKAHRNNVYASGDYSGRMTDGTVSTDLIGLSVKQNWGGKVIFETAILPSDQQFVLFAFSGTQNGKNDYSTRGIFSGYQYYEFTAQGLTISPDWVCDFSDKFMKIKSIDGVIDVNSDGKYVILPKGGFARLI